MKLTRALGATFLFVVLLLATYYVHIRYFTVNVVFYAAIADGVIATVLTAILISGSHTFNGFEKLLLVVIWLLSGYAFAISVSTVRHRSRAESCGCSTRPATSRICAAGMPAFASRSSRSPLEKSQVQSATSPSTSARRATLSMLVA